MKEKSLTVYKILNVFFFLAMVAVNALSATLPINGITPGAVSDSYFNLFAPAGLTFSIWGVIYLLLAAFILYQLGLFGGKKANTGLVKKMSLYFMISSAANIAWIFSWHYRIIPLSMVLMTVLLLSLILGYSAIRKFALSTSEKVFIKLPFSVYFGWITVATIANVTTLLVDLKWNGFGLPVNVWTIIALAAGVLIGVATILKFKTYAYGLVLLWAYFGILYKHLTFFESKYPDVIIAAAVAMAIFLITCISAFVQLRTKKA